MKKKKKIIIAAAAAAITLLIALLLFVMPTLTAVNVGSPSVTDMFDYNGGPEWKSLDTPEHFYYR